MVNWLTSEVLRVQGWSYRHWVVSNFAGVLQANYKDIGDELDSLLTQSDKAIKHDRTTTVGRLTVGGDVVIVKRYNARNQWHKLKRCLRRTRAQRCWCMSYLFQQAGLNVAAPQLMHEKRWGPLRQNAYFVTEYLKGAELLGLLPSMNAQQQRQVAAEVMKAFEIMRREKLTHGDMKASNLLWVDGQLFFIDLDAATKHRSLISWRRSHARDLKRFRKNWLEHAELNQLFEQLLST